MFKHAVPALVLGAGAPAAGTSCTAPPPTPVSKPAPAPTAPAPTPTTTATYTGGQGGDGSADGCPTTGAILLKALVKTKYHGAAAPAGQTLTKIRCYDGWAIAIR